MLLQVLEGEPPVVGVRSRQLVTVHHPKPTKAHGRGTVEGGDAPALRLPPLYLSPQPRRTTPLVAPRSAPSQGYSQSCTGAHCVWVFEGGGASASRCKTEAVRDRASLFRGPNPPHTLPLNTRDRCFSTPTTYRRRPVCVPPPRRPFLSSRAEPIDCVWNPPGAHILHIL